MAASSSRDGQENSFSLTMFPVEDEVFRFPLAKPCVRPVEFEAGSTAHEASHAKALALDQVTGVEAGNGPDRAGSMVPASKRRRFGRAAKGTDVSALGVAAAGANIVPVTCEALVSLMTGRDVAATAEKRRVVGVSTGTCDQAASRERASHLRLTHSDSSVNKCSKQQAKCEQSGCTVDRRPVATCFLQT